jgi:hypothetical protein
VLWLLDVHAVFVAIVDFVEGHHNCDRESGADVVAFQLLDEEHIVYDIYLKRKRERCTSSHKMKTYTHPFKEEKNERWTKSGGGSYNTMTKFTEKKCLFGSGRQIAHFTAIDCIWTQVDGRKVTCPQPRSNSLIQLIDVEKEAKSFYKIIFKIVPCCLPGMTHMLQGSLHHHTKCV